MEEECAEITTVEELSVLCCWEEEGLPLEHFFEIVDLKKADVESISSGLIEWSRKNLQVENIVGMGFDGANTFSGRKNGVQAANSTTKVKHAYTTLSLVLKIFHLSPKRTETLIEVQRVIDLPEWKLIKPRGTHWLAHERCIKGVKTVMLQLQLLSLLTTRMSQKRWGLVNSLEEGNNCSNLLT